MSKLLSGRMEMEDEIERLVPVSGKGAFHGVIVLLNALDAIKGCYYSVQLSRHALSENLEIS